MSRSLLQRLVSALQSRPALYRKLRYAYRRVTQGPQSIEGQIRQRLRGMHSVFFVQIGSNDGRHGDPIAPMIRREPRWSGIFVDIFRRLKQNYGEAPRFTFENVLIGESQQPTKFYFVAERAKAELGDALPYWYDQLGSFNREHIAKHLDGKLVPYIEEIDLPTVSLPTLLDRNGVAHVDLLHIDTEGYDYEVLRQFEFERLRPAVVLYEHKHLPPDSRAKAQALLKQYGYEIRVRPDDTLALLPR